MLCFRENEFEHLFQARVKTTSKETHSVYSFKNEALNEKILFLNIGYSSINYFFPSRLKLVKFKSRIRKFSNSISSKTKA